MRPYNVAVMTVAVLALLAAAFPNANLYGTGDRAVILAHGGQFDRKSWQPQASELVKAGFRVMTIDFAGAPDILAAVHYLRKNGAKTVSVVGASMGGDYAIEAAEAEPAAFDRIVLLGAGAYSPLIKMKGPKLYIVARDDANADGPRLPNIQKQYDKTVEPKKLIVLKGAAHAQFLFQTDQGARVMSEILRFLSASRPTP
jgi:pimeloyl-ACP methyl ester carboxylesterase